MKQQIALIISVTLLTACGGGGGSNKEEPVVNLNIEKNLNINNGSSHELQKSSVYAERSTFGDQVRAIVYGDFNGDTFPDVFAAPGVHLSEIPTPIELYLNDGSGNFNVDNDFLSDARPSFLAARKAISGDYNGDGKVDVFIAAHGVDVAPFLGEAAGLILSTSDGYSVSKGMDSFSGFQHGAASADIDADGDVDIFVANTEQPYFMINNGSGVFIKDTSRLVDLSNSSFYTVELLDVDQDGFADLVVAGHEYEGFLTRILWGDSTGFYSAKKSAVLPNVEGQGIVVDIDFADLNGNGRNDVVVLRTGDPENGPGFYQGYYMQLLQSAEKRGYVDITATNLPESSALLQTFIDSVRLQDHDADGHIDIMVDDAARNLILTNDGNGTANFQ